MTLDAGKYSRTVTLQCPTCGGTQFEYDENAPNPLVKCNACNRETTKDNLIADNNENVSEHIAEMGKEVVKDLQQELRKAFSGNKFFKIR